MNDAIKMQISAFVDGELPQNEAELLLRRLCQDRELRQQAAEYLAMGRIMRGERALTGMAALRDRIAVTLDEPGFEEGAAVATSTAPRFMRSLAGVAIAASVALVAILGLQQMSVDTQPDAATSPGVADAADRIYTVPDGAEDRLADYRRSHNRSSSYVGAPSLSPELVRYDVSDELPPADEPPALDDDAEPESDSAGATTAP